MRILLATLAAGIRSHQSTSPAVSPVTSEVPRRWPLAARTAGATACASGERLRACRNPRRSEADEPGAPEGHGEVGASRLALELSWREFQQPAPGRCVASVLVPLPRQARKPYRSGISRQAPAGCARCWSNGVVAWPLPARSALNRSGFNSRTQGPGDELPRGRDASLIAAVAGAS